MSLFALSMFALSFEQKMWGSYIFAGLLAIFIVGGIIALVRSVILSKKYDMDSLPTLEDLNLGANSEPVEEEENVDEDDDGVSAFSMDLLESESDGDSFTNSFLREANLNSHNTRKEKKVSLFKKK